jgi:hypothetical protein
VSTMKPTSDEMSLRDRGGHYMCRGNAQSCMGRRIASPLPMDNHRIGRHQTVIPPNKCRAVRQSCNGERHRLGHKPVRLAGPIPTDHGERHRLGHKPVRLTSVQVQGHAPELQWGATPTGAQTSLASRSDTHGPRGAAMGSDTDWGTNQFG